MRIADVMNSALDGVKYVVDLHEGELDLTSYLGLPEGVEYVRASSRDVDAPIDDQTLVLDLLGPDPRRHRPLERITDTLAMLDGARRLVLLFGYEESELPVHRVVDLMRGTSWRISAAIPLGYRHISTGIVVEPTDADPSVVAEHNLLRLSELGTRTLRARLVAREAELERLRSQLPVDIDAVEERESDTGEPRTEADELREEIDTLRVDRQRLRELERSTTYQVGRIVVDAFAKPGKRTLKAPSTLVKMFKERSERARQKGASNEVAPTRPQPLRPLRTQKLITPFPSPVDADLNGVLTLAGVWSRESERLLDPDTRAVTLHPNQAVAQVWRSDPDIVIVQASAASAGSPWASLGTSAGVVRDQELRALLDAAARRDVPAVLWFDRPSHLVPGLDAIADRFDLVLTDRGPWADVERGDAFSLGVQLARFGVLTTPPPEDRYGTPRFLGALDPRLGVRRRARLAALLEAALPHGLQCFDDGALDDLAGPPPPIAEALLAANAGYLPASRRPATFRREGTWIATPFLGGERTLHRRAVEQLAAGAQIITADPVAVPSSLRNRVFDGSTDPAGAMVAALGSESDSNVNAGQFAVLRDLYERAATARWVARLARACGLAVDPDDAVATTMVVLGVTPATVDTVVASVLGQRQRPAACVLGLAPGVAPASVAAALTALSRAGIVASAASDAPLPATIANVATRWCAVVPAEDLRPCHLLDLHVLRACSQASVLALRDAPAGRAPLLGALVRTDLVASGAVVLHGGGDEAWWEAPDALIATYDPIAIGVQS